LFDLFVVGDGANTLYSMFRHSFEKSARGLFNWASVENVNIRTTMKELDILLFEHQPGAGLTGMPVFGFVLGFESVPGRSDVAHVILLNGGGPHGVKGPRVGTGKWKDNGIRASMHNAIFKSIAEIARERGWRLYTADDLAKGTVRLPGWGAPMLPEQLRMLGPGAPPPGWR